MTIPTLSRPSVHRGGSTSRADGRLSSSPFHAIARVLLIATICGAPWAFGAIQPKAWGTLLVLALLALVLWAVGCAHRGILKITWPTLYWPFLAFLILAAVQLFAGLNSDHVAAREAVLKIVTDLVFFFLAGQLLNPQPENGRVLEWFGLIVTLLAISLCILALAQILWSNGSLVIYWTVAVRGSPFGPYANRNDYAGLMEMLLPISVAYLLSRSSDPIPRFFLWSGVILVITSIWISGSRGAALVLLIEGLLFAGILLWRRPRGVSPRSFAVLLGVVLISTAFFSWMVKTRRVGGRAWSVFEASQPLGVTLGDRLRVGIDTLHIVRNHPWIGVGVGCFESVFPSYMTFPSYLHWAHAHDDILEAVAETGLPGAVMILVALVLFYRAAFRQIEERMRQGWGWIQMGAAVGAVGLFCHSFVDFNLRNPANAAWFVVCLAVATHAGFSPDLPRIVARDLRSQRNGGFVT